MIDDGMTADVGSVVRERAQRERILIQVRGVLKQGLDKVAAAHVVHQIAEKLAAERVVAHVLHNTSAVGVGMRLL